MRKALFPHMEWAKAHTKTPLPIELGFSGASHPRGASFQEFGSGDPELQRRIARRYGVSKDRVYLAGGTSLANFITIAALVDPGDPVAVEIPRYHPLAEIPRGLGARVLDIKRKRSGALGKIPRKARLLILTSPHNPTGKLIHDADWSRLEQFAEQGGTVIVDEVYRDLQQRPPKVAAARHDRFVTTGGLTKAYGLGGLRLGWVLAAPKLLGRVRRVDNLVSVQCSTPSLLALRRIWPRLNELKRRTMRPVAANLATLRDSGLDFIEPDAGLTAFVKVGDSAKVCSAMEELGVGFAAGEFFGAPRYLRAFLGADPRAFAHGIAHLRDYLEGR